MFIPVFMASSAQRLLLAGALLAALIKQIKADGVHTWFMENLLDPRRAARPTAM